MNRGGPIEDLLARRAITIGEIRKLRRLLETKRAFGLPFAVRAVASDASRLVDVFAGFKFQFGCLGERACLHPHRHYNKRNDRWVFHESPRIYGVGFSASTGSMLVMKVIL